MKLTRNRIISVILIVLLVFSSTVTAFADDEAENKEDQKKQEEELQAKKEAEKKAAEEKAKKEAEAKAAEKAKQEAEAKAEEERKAKEAKEAEEAQKKQDAQDDTQKDNNEADASQEPAPDGDTSAESDVMSQDTSLSTEEDKDSDNAKTLSEGNKDRKLKLNETLSDGTYKPEDFKFEGGTGKASLSCDTVIIKDGKSYAVFTASTETLTHIYMGAVKNNNEDPSLYDPETDALGKDVYKIKSQKVSVPVALNKTKDVSLRSVAMTNPHWIKYKYTITLTKSTSKVSDDTTIPEFEEKEEDPEEEEEEEEPDKPGKTSKLKDGTYKVKATTCRKMFYLYPKEKNPAQVILTVKNGKMTATITLTGTGYDYVYMGTPKQAKKAGKKKWIKYKKVKGYYTFKIPVSALDKRLNITPHSSKYQKLYGDNDNPDTDPWRANKWIKFYSKGAKKVKAGTSIKTKGKAASKNDNNSTTKKGWADDSKKGTSAVNNSTKLKDGTYKPDRFNWSGGSGRLAYIRCTKITVKGGKAYATLEFSSSKYDSLRASGRTYHKQGGGNSKFTIPVKLNANNTIVGRTTAMSQPHWVAYRIFIYKKGAGTGKGSSSDEGDDGHVTSTKKLSSKAPDLMGLEFKEEVEVKYAKYFKIFKYEQGITLIEIDQASDTALYKEEKKDKEKGNSESESSGNDQGHLEYDEEGNIIAQSQNEIVDGLYQNNVVNYIIVPENVEIPAGLDKDGIILQQPVDKSFIASEKAAEVMEQLGLLDNVKTVGFDAEQDGSDELRKALEADKLALAGSAEKPDYAALVKTEADMGIFPAAVLPDKLKKDAAQEEQEEADEKTETLGILRKRFAALGVPMMIDRSEDEKTNYASAEWIKVYGAVFDKEDEADKAFEKYIADNKKENNEQ